MQATATAETSVVPDKSKRRFGVGTPSYVQGVEKLYALRAQVVTRVLRCTRVCL
eukprot:m.70116 g.70116  ORF g.70116 m.70116 type:complete len:54 (+) comp12249_c1_seq6:1094-1255(+)